MTARLSVLCLILLGGCATVPRPAGHQNSAPAAPKRGELDRLVADVCQKQIVLLGEATHGDGRTIELKARLVRRLIRECGFDSVLFEAGVYDFLQLERAYAAGTAEAKQLSSAIGAIWSTAREAQPLIAFLHRAASKGRVRIMGIDDQIHSTAWFAQKTLPDLLAAYLSGHRRAECRAAIQRHTDWKYDDATPYTRQRRAALSKCLQDVRAVLRSLPASPKTEEARLMTGNLLRWISRDFGTDRYGSFNARDASMFQNVRWHRSRLGPRAKSIIWCATIHAAKTLAGLGRYDRLVPLGQHVHQRYGSRAAAIGFTAYAGASRPPGKGTVILTTAPDDALETRALKPGQTLHYLEPRALRAQGEISARPIGHRFIVAHWDRVLDGVVVLGRERPTTRGVAATRSR